jgi:hypothetical protein
VIVTFVLLNFKDDTAPNTGTLVALSLVQGFSGLSEGIAIES